jgi:calcineurin-like phosphoesterase family protein
MSRIYFCSDTHFYHNNIIEYAKRPFSDIHEMNSQLIINWNKVIQPNDVVYHLGDFAFASFNSLNEILNSLNGKIHITLGNHDQLIKKHKNTLLNNKKIFSIQDYLEVNIQKRKFCLSHYAMRVWNSCHYGAIHLYGHSHGALKSLGLSVDIGIDCKDITSEYRPVSIDEVLNYMSKIQ